VRILHLIQELGIGGAERMVTALVAGAHRAGHQVAVAAAHGPLAEELGVPIFPLPMVRRRLRNVPATARAVGRAVRAWSPEIVHCHNPSMAVAFALRTVRRVPCRAVVTIEGLVDSDYRRAARLLRWISMPAVACSPAVAARLGEHGVAAATIVNGVGPAPRPAARGALEAEWPCLRGRRFLVAVGRLAPQKNFALAIEALARVAGAALVIMGDGPDRGPLEQRAAALGVRDRLALPGFRADVREIVAAADAFILPSRWEGMPLVALEALAAGRPLVAARASWQAGFLSEGEDCLLADAGDPDQFAAAVRRVLDDSALAASLSAHAIQRAADYTEDRTVSAYLQLYDALGSS
jgi:glycosyltransferase involved in cell wall biosynthesis